MVKRCPSCDNMSVVWVKRVGKNVRKASSLDKNSFRRCFNCGYEEMQYE